MQPVYMRMPYFDKNKNLKITTTGVQVLSSQSNPNWWRIKLNRWLKSIYDPPIEVSIPDRVAGNYFLVTGHSATDYNGWVTAMPLTVNNTLDSPVYTNGTTFATDHTDTPADVYQNGSTIEFYASLTDAQDGVGPVLERNPSSGASFANGDGAFRPYNATEVPAGVLIEVTGIGNDYDGQYSDSGETNSKSATLLTNGTRFIGNSALSSGFSTLYPDLSSAQGSAAQAYEFKNPGTGNFVVLNDGGPIWATNVRVAGTSTEAGFAYWIDSIS